MGRVGLVNARRLPYSGVIAPIDGPSRWRSALPPELAERIDGILAAAMHLAHAARPAGASPAVVEYWCSLSTFAQQAHVMRAADATARALGLPWRSERRG